jgi:KipI family sensor histidine kinase inhibitor
VAAVETAAAGADHAPPETGPLVTLTVHYDGADLADVAQLTGYSVDEVVRRHRAAEYTVAFCGFAPGFAYLTGLDPTLQVPRLSTPRADVPAGAVGIAGEYTAAYPRPSPGGWRLIGRTDARLWSLGRAEPALLVAGTRVRFEPR